MIPIRPWLFVGRFRDTKNRELLEAHHIGAMLQLAEPVQQPGIDSLYLPVEDGEAIQAAYLYQGIEFICTQKKLGRVVLVACGAGQSRSVAFAAAALVEEEGLDLLDALKAIRDCHPEAGPHPQILESLAKYYGSTASLQQLVKAAWRH